MVMNECIIPLETSGRLFELLAELKSTGLKEGKDFEFYYEPPVEDYDENLSFGRLKERQVKFIFADPANATWFKLKWS
jgi:hypothetical protein